MNCFVLLLYINIYLPLGCGVKGGSGTKIVGGVDADENEYPWQCSVLNKDNSV